VPGKVVGGGGEEDDEPPQPVRATKAKTIAGMHRERLRRLANSNTEAAKVINSTKTIPGGKLRAGPPLALPDAVVPTVTVTAAFEPPARLTEAGTPQTGAGVAAGVIPHVRFTVPLNDPTGESTKLKVAVCPAEMVAVLEPPEAVPKVKPGAATPVPLRLMVCGELNALSEI
jgi:hypothetical protein